jgi:hypothetical protein
MAIISSLNVKTKTDAVDARILSQFGVEGAHKLWIPPPAGLFIEQATGFAGTGVKIQNSMIKGNGPFICS